MYKSKLQEVCQQRGWVVPKYETSKLGLDHNPQFSATVTVNSFSFSSQSLARSSKEAQNDAARLAFLHFSPPSPNPAAASSPARNEPLPTSSKLPPTTSCPPATTSRPPPMSSDPPRTTSHSPPTTSHSPPMTSRPPPMSSDPPRMASHSPPTTSRPPPMSSDPPRMASHPPRTTSHPPPTTSPPPPIPASEAGFRVQQPVLPRPASKIEPQQGESGFSLI